MLHSVQSQHNPILSTPIIPEWVHPGFGIVPATLGFYPACGKTGAVRVAPVGDMSMTAFQVATVIPCPGQTQQ